MRKLLIAVATAAIAISGLALSAQADKGKGGTSWDFSLSPNKKGKPSGTDSLIKPAQENEDGSVKETKKTTITFPAGTAFDTSVPPRCKASGGELVSSNGEVCKKAQIGDGDARALIGTLTTSALLKAYNKKGGIFFLIISCNPGTGPGQADKECTPLSGGTFALEGTLKYADKRKTKPILIVPTPSTLLQNNIIITLFHLNTEKMTKTRKVNGKKVLVSYVINPSKCKGTWKSSAFLKYDDGTDQTIKDSQPCK